MAKKAGTAAGGRKNESAKKVTSIGNSKRSRQNNKNKKRGQKRKYRGQGK